MIYNRDKLPAKVLSVADIPNSIECGIIEINVRKKKWMMLEVYRRRHKAKVNFWQSWQGLVHYEI